MSNPLARLDWNKIDDCQSLNGWRLSRLIKAMLPHYVEQYGRCGCDEPHLCVHAGAASLDGMLRIIEHPPDCPDCARIARERET